jgi:hypothetical protein
MEWLGEDESQSDDSVVSANVNDVFGVKEVGFAVLQTAL